MNHWWSRPSALLSIRLTLSPLFTDMGGPGRVRFHPEFPSALPLSQIVLCNCGGGEVPLAGWIGELACTMIKETSRRLEEARATSSTRDRRGRSPGILDDHRGHYTSRTLICFYSKKRKSAARRERTA